MLTCGELSVSDGGLGEAVPDGTAVRNRPSPVQNMERNSPEFLPKCFRCSRTFHHACSQPPETADCLAVVERRLRRIERTIPYLFRLCAILAALVVVFLIVVGVI